MKKRNRILCIIVFVLLLLLLIAGIVFAWLSRTDYPDAVTEADGVYMEWIEEPNRELLSYQICNTSENPVYGDNYQLEYKFLGRWYRLMYRAGATYTLEGIVVGEYADILKREETRCSIMHFCRLENIALCRGFTR
ncbi:MAG: hypothetical protein IKZ09_05770 [Clostridia bacterium]|nr:hypothetical protein [Clostridia bacterium]